MRPFATLFLLLLILSPPAFVSARDRQTSFRTVQTLDGFSLHPDRAYLLIRIHASDHTRFTGPILMRVPSPDQVDAYDQAKRAAYAKAGAKAGPYDAFAFTPTGMANLFAVDPVKAVVKAPPRRTLLVEADPGEYVLYGLGGAAAMHACFCLGTVKFQAVPGRVTDLGTLLTDLVDKPSIFPELRGETGLGPIGRFNMFGMTGGIRPARTEDEVPHELFRLPRAAADYRAVGTFYQSGVQQIMRLAPVPAVLGYDGGKVVDLRTGGVVEDQQPAGSATSSR